MVQPHRFERLIVEGGGWAGLAINKTQAELVDVGIHRGHSGILGDGASIEAERLLITQSILDGVNLRLGSAAVLRDVGVYESVSTGLVFKGEGPYRGTRVKVATERRSATGINLEEAFNNPVSVFLRELEVQGPFAGSIQVGNGTGLEVTHFRIDGANLGVELLGVNGRRWLKKGTIRTESTGLDVANDLADLAPLLDGVRVEAPRPIKRTKPVIRSPRTSAARPKARARAERALRPDRAAHPLDQPLDDRRSEARASGLLRAIADRRDKSARTGGGGARGRCRGLDRSPTAPPSPRAARPAA